MTGALMPHRPASLLQWVRLVGRYGWLGGYTHAVLLDDGGVLGPECVRPNYREVSWATRHGEHNGWCAVGIVALDGEDEPTTCAHCGKELQ
jgi:hypothetical protein